MKMYPNIPGLLCLVILVIGCASSDPGPIAIEFYDGNFAPDLAPQGHAWPDSFLVVSYNIAHARQAALAVEEILSDPRIQQVDVLLLQEMDAIQSEYMARQLEMNYVYAPAYIHTRSKRRYGTSVLSRWPILESRGLVLPHPNPFSSNHRRAVSADLKVGERRLRVVSVHLSTIVIPLNDRMDQVATLVDTLGQVDGPIIIGGDFNTVGPAEVIKARQAMRQGGFRQVRLPRGHTADPRPIDMINFDLVLDHFFYRGLVAHGSGIAHEFKASDHFPVWAFFAFED